MYKRLEEQLIKIRVKQLIVNEKYNEKQFKIPIHLALGHESLAVAVTENISASDTLVLSHRNIHYNLCKEESLSKVIDEYLGKASGLAKGSAGSMNLYNCVLQLRSAGAGCEPVVTRLEHLFRCMPQTSQRLSLRHTC